MKTTHIILTVILAATSAIQTANAEHKLPAPLPEFKTPEQLAFWRKEMATKAASTDALAVKQVKSALPIARSSLTEGTSVFYTAKPYLEETGSYAFKFRNYDPELNRWTSLDPSGFPNGANNSLYTPIPTTGCDPLGLYSAEDAVNDFSTVGLARDLFSLAGFSMSLRRADHALAYGDNETAPSGEIGALKSSSYFTDIFKTSYFSALVGPAGSSSPYSKQDQLVQYGGINDLHFSYGRVTYAVTGQFTWDQNNKWSTVATFAFADLYDFDINSPIEAIAAFARLQENHYAGMYNTSGTFAITFNE